MAKYPEVRYSTAGAFASALAEAAEPKQAASETAVAAGETGEQETGIHRAPEPTAVGPPPLVVPAPTAPQPTNDQPTYQQQPPGQNRRWAIAALIAIGLLVAVLGISAGVLFTRGDPAGAASPDTTTTTITVPGETTTPSPTTNAPPPPATSPPPPAPQQPPNQAANRQYQRTIDDMLIDSARTRKDLGSVIARASSESTPYATIAAEIDSITAQRESLLRAASAVSVPPDFSRSATFLRRSLVASIEDDRAIDSWIDAKYFDDPLEDFFWKQNVRLSAEASRAKTAFLREYNARRRELLDLPTLDVAY
jgi:hypothetical protein